MAYILWLLFMGVIVGFLAAPIAQRVGYRYGRFGRTGDLIAVIAGTVLGGVLLAIVGGAIGLSLGGNGGALVGGILGAIVAILLLALFSTQAANAEPTNTQEDIAGPYGTSSDRK